jgi:gamma-glutamyltranspeptidase/glutathione hydrolase
MPSCASALSKVLAISIFSLISFSANASPAAPVPSAEPKGLVVAVSPPGAEVGRDVLRRGGNAVDAAVATAFAMAVTYPAAGNIGGGGFMLVYPGGKEHPVVIDYREKAPAAASRTMYHPGDSIYTHRAVGVPGTVRGLALAHQKFGRLPWRDLVMPAVRLAEDGFEVDAVLAGSLNAAVSFSGDFHELRRVLGKDEGRKAWHAGDRLIQKDLAWTLRQIADRGPEGFYQGPVADLLCDEMHRGGGLITSSDLEAYRAKVREPIHGTYRGLDVYAPPPPSSGGVCLVEMLNILEHFDLRKQGRWSPQTLHVMIEAMRRAYCDRAHYLGDADFVTIPAHLTSKEYAGKLAKSIDLHRATRSEDLARDIPLTAGGDNTTHFSVIDRNGMAVSNTYTLERSYGSHIVVRGAGFVLNNEMMDFNWLPGKTTRSGQIGTEANQIAPGKRMLSSQTPTILARDGRPILVTGSPGSRTIINTVLCVVVNVVDFDMDIQAAVNAPRLHHAWFPDEVLFEGTDEHAGTVRALEAMGHRVRGNRQGDAHSIWFDVRTGRYVGAADPRINGKVAAE